ncbi:helix-turn-helix domain-containing protein [Geoalkalibacter sp.]|uniref:helix-turn-helix domain-containing protein n=1 Tax=Geoalkalibacter sp. TaxID=3041440 RepID=UPI00272ED7E0|nr:helix-turn-helix transcriptional regulator [Geoalkalibacter sp.]
MDQRIISTKHLGEALRAARKNKGLTQQQAAKSVGLDQPSMSKIERGESYARIDTLFRLLAALDLEMVIQSRQHPLDESQGDRW